MTSSMLRTQILHDSDQTRQKNSTQLVTKHVRRVKPSTLVSVENQFIDVLKYHVWPFVLKSSGKHYTKLAV